MDSSEIRPFRETGEHSYHRRSFYHDYHAPFIYHVIIKKAKDCPDFGAVAGDARIAPGRSGCAVIMESELGRTVAKALLHLPYKYPVIRLYQFCVMPDHVHVLLQIQYRSERHLDFYIEALKEVVVATYSEVAGRRVNVEDFFEPGYCDKPLYDNRSLDGLFRYIRENPHRLAMRKQFPQFFRCVRKLRVVDREYEAYGNLFLLRNPDMVAVRISRKFSEEQKRHKRDQWLSSAARGTVFISPFISPIEKAIRAEAEAIGSKIILITHEAFPEQYKPAAHDFGLCCEGRLLIISLGLPGNTPLTRDLCLRMNTLAETIAAGDFN